MTKDRNNLGVAALQSALEEIKWRIDSYEDPEAGWDNISSDYIAGLKEACEVLQRSIRDNYKWTEANKEWEKRFQNAK